MERTASFGHDRNCRHESLPSKKTFALKMPVGNLRPIVKVLEPRDTFIRGDESLLQVPVEQANSKQVEVPAHQWYKGMSTCRSCVAFQTSKYECQPLRPIIPCSKQGGKFPKSLKLGPSKKRLRKPSTTIANNLKNTNKRGLQSIPDSYRFSFKDQPALIDETSQEDPVGWKTHHLSPKLEHATIVSQSSEGEFDEHHKPLPSIVARPFPKPTKATTLLTLRSRVWSSPKVPRLVGDPIDLDITTGDSVQMEPPHNFKQLLHQDKKTIFEKTSSESEFLKKPQVFSWKSSAYLASPKHLTSDEYWGQNRFLCAPGIGFRGYCQQCAILGHHQLSFKSGGSEEKQPQESSSSLGKIEVSLRNAPSYLFSKTGNQLLKSSGPISSSSSSEDLH